MAFVFDLPSKTKFLILFALKHIVIWDYKIMIFFACGHTALLSLWLLHASSEISSIYLLSEMHWHCQVHSHTTHIPDFLLKNDNNAYLKYCSLYCSQRISYCIHVLPPCSCESTSHLARRKTQVNILNVNWPIFSFISFSPPLSLRHFVSLNV